MTIVLDPKTAALAACLSAICVPGSAEQLRIVALGDMPYGEPAEVNPIYEALIEEINAQPPDLVIHIGDTKSGSTPCSDEMLDQQLSYLNGFSAPTIYSPGDNEWTDCHREAAGAFDPLDRLAHIRLTYFADPARSFGSTSIEVTHQADAGYPENTRVMLGDLTVVAAHVVGSNNNFETRDQAASEEFFARDAANIDWLNASFDAAASARALVLAIHADMFGSGFNEADEETWVRHSGFANFGEVLKTRAAAFGKPILLVYGDSHVFKVHRPFPQGAPNLMALEVFGADDMHAVEISVDTATDAVFGFRPVLNPKMGLGG